jgi:3-oxoacyl-[acyl-carrier protein] reductase
MFENKIVFITGAASGMGFDAACRFMDDGSHVIGCDRDKAGLSRLETYASERHARYVSVVVDLSDISSFTQAEAKVRLLGRLDVLVNCAGICSGTKLDDITQEEWERTYAVNVKGPFFLTRALLPYLQKGQNPTIINISSMAGFTGGILSNPAYSSSKAAVTCMTKNLAKHCAPMGIRVNEISPGTAVTAMTENWLGREKLKDFVPQVPMGRLAEAGDVAKVILFLASDDAGFITGQTIHVNGGMYIP